MSKEKIIANVKKIAVLRANALGDFIFVLPALNSLRNAYPNAEIVYLGCPWHREFLSNRPSPVDRVIVVPVSQGVREDGLYDEQVLNRFFKEISSENFDIALQLHGGGKYSNPFLLNLGAKLTVGFKTQNAKGLDISLPYYVYQNEYSRYLEAINVIGGDINTVMPQLQVTRNDIEEAKMHIKRDEPFVVIHPGATDLRRRWPAEYFSQVGDYLYERGYSVFVTGKDAERDTVDRVIYNMRGRAVNLCGKLSLSGLTGLLALSEMVVANDTGPLHLADAVGAKTVGIYWCGNGLVSAPLFRKKNRVLLSWVIECPLCGASCASKTPFQRDKNSCQHLTSFVQEVRPSDVIEEVKSLLSKEFLFGEKGFMTH